MSEVLKVKNILQWLSEWNASFPWFFFDCGLVHLGLSFSKWLGELKCHGGYRKNYVWDVHRICLNSDYVIPRPLLDWNEVSRQINLFKISPLNLSWPFQTSRGGSFEENDWSTNSWLKWKGVNGPFALRIQPKRWDLSLIQNGKKRVSCWRVTEVTIWVSMTPPSSKMNQFEWYIRLTKWEQDMWWCPKLRICAWNEFLDVETLEYLLVFQKNNGISIHAYNFLVLEIGFEFKWRFPIQIKMSDQTWWLGWCSCCWVCPNDVEFGQSVTWFWI